MASRRVCVVSGSRADYGLLYWVMQEIRDHPLLDLQVVLTGMHLSSRFGETWRQVVADGFPIDARVETLLENEDTPEAITRSVGVGVSGFAGTLTTLNPDFVVVLGDRFEIFAAAQAALLGNRVIAHIAGGDVTEGAVDEAMRHAITKMAHLHFVTNADAEARVRQLGENPARVFNTGSPGLDYLKRTVLLSRASLEEELGIRFRKRNLLVTFHPATLEADPPEVQFAQVLTAIDEICAEQETTVVFTRPNADAGNERISRLLDSRSEENFYSFVSLGTKRYLSLMANSDVVIGNSSSGLYEAPSLKVPTVNIGERQKGRLLASSVISCAPNARDVAAAIRRAFLLDCSGTINPYGDGESARRIIAELAAVPEPRALLKKKFFDVR
ncbi:UDP-N-acetylglucosamine 2-epimerase [Pseudorhodoplanes sp.]|uniref:UDP-N-acetylglucosamine 2-epimerase n=1 Tax=Pseudorhodoplanes sp. TaxID=1934341 RepID=UPI003D096807